MAARSPTQLRRAREDVALLAADPDLGAQLDEASAAEARQALRVPALTLPKGPWEPRLNGEMRGSLGLLILDGVLARTVDIGEGAHTELLGAGDLLRPWQHDHGVVPCEVTWHVLEPVRMGVLNRAFTADAGRWPELIGELFARAIRRSRAQDLLSAIGHVRRVDTRVLILLWHLAERWGRVSPEGLVIPIELTHERLADLVGAQRPSVSTAVTKLVSRGLIARRSDRRWLLLPEGIKYLEEICPAAGGNASAGAPAPVWLARAV